jgi:hypothetical protein
VARRQAKGRHKPVTGDKHMDDMELERSLKGVGKACFVKYYELFRDKSRTDDLLVVDYLVKNGEYKNRKYTESGAKIRVSFAKRIFNAGREKDALKFCARAGISGELVNKAKMLLKGA